ncbi:MAG: 1,4-alpha-glucan branching protein [Verrucomicrobiales bacterium]|nr:1,4-alpha-glucan branching protein [Verrucomicrobiales bacterium]
MHFRVWAAKSQRVAVLLGRDPELTGDTQCLEMEPETQGIYSLLVPKATAGMYYKFRLDHGTFPDPASRFQPQGPHGASQIVDPGSFRWSDQQWKGVRREGQVIYEMHIGTFTPEGTYAAAAAQLEELARVGVTVIELMPVADFPGRFGWGYDGVNLFAPTRLYGTPDELRNFVDRAHAAGVGVILDVVYNHLGPDGNYLKEFSDDYVTDRYANEWGEALNFDGPNNGPVREFFISNAGYWIEEFHMDGLRLDATQQIFDSSPVNVMTEITRQARACAKGRETYIVAENEPQHPNLVRDEKKGGYGMDALWNDDFHHSGIVALAGRNEAYYTDYEGSPQEFISATKWGYLYQGQHYKWQKKRRGKACLDLDPDRFIAYIQNHDQIANSLRGIRLHHLTSPGRYKALTALLLLSPSTPMLFQGQEFAASTPFYYFADHNPELSRLVAKGRSEFLRQFPTIASSECRSLLSNPSEETTFLKSKLDFNDREKHSELYQLHQDLLKLRREDPVFSKPRKRGVDGAVLGPEAFVLRFFAEDGMDRLLLVNLGRDLHLNPAPEPLLGPVEGYHWKMLWSSECPDYGGCGTPPLDTEENWKIPGHAAVVLIPEEETHAKGDPQN